MDGPVLDAKPKERTTARIALLLALLTGFALRLLHLGAESLWYDETVSVHLARQPIPAMIAHTAGDIHPPGYYLLLHLWQQLTAPTLLHGLEYLYAWPSVFAGMVVLALLYATGRRLFNPKVALVAVTLAAVNPFQIWYSQEVRMYTAGAALGLLCLWALLAFAGGRHKVRWLTVYALAAAAGLYTLYYFAFWLIALNLAALLLLWAPATGRGRRFAAWLAAQVATLVLFAPWLPIVARQVTDPPVPPWRAPWQSAGAFLASAGEALAALLVGQSPPGAIVWPWAIPVLALVTGFGWWAWGNRGQSRRGTSAAIVLILVFVPIGLLFAITLFATPIYHVRYIYLYATIFLLVPAVLLVAIWRRWQWLGGAVLFLLLAISAWSLLAFWTNPRYRADDHRGAVAQLAAQWRPGDAILANAGWIYPVLTTYWPVDVAGINGSVPPPISTLTPIDGYAQFTAADPTMLQTPAVARSGSVDGEPSLGWGNPESDFFAISEANTTAALDAISASAGRLWHYRLYDTVNDPDGAIRGWLDNNATLLAETPIPGRDFGLLQLYDLPGTASIPPLSPADAVCFAGALCLDGYAQPASATAGAPLYVASRWRATQALPDLALSLRLYDSDGRLAAQADGPSLPATSTWAPQESQSQPLALPLPVSLKPGSYRTEVVVYRADDGAPLPPDEAQRAIEGQRWPLGTVEIVPAAQAPELPAPLATFDYLELVDVQLDRTEAAPGDSVQMTAYWQPRPSPYRDSYRANIALHAVDGSEAQAWAFTLGGDAYPSGAWPAERPVRDGYALPLAESLAPGAYTLSVGLTRASDAAVIAAQQGWRTVEQVPVGTITITP